jgi:hypothetical protein
MANILACFIALLLATVVPCAMAFAGSSPTALTIIPNGRLHVTQRGAQTVLSGAMHGRSFKLTLPAEDGIYPRSLESAELLGAVADDVVILSIDYASRPGNPNAECGAGTETVLRVITMKPTIQQTFHTLVDSCWDSIEVTSVDWDKDARALVAKLSTPAGDVVSRYAITPDGKVTAVEDHPAGTGTPANPAD